MKATHSDYYGYYLKGNKFKDDKKFRKQYDKQRWDRRLAKLAYGCVPIEQLSFNHCAICGQEIYNYKTTMRETCGRKCGHKLAMNRKWNR